jgi:hypothetical protein
MVNASVAFEFVKMARVSRGTIPQSRSQSCLIHYKAGCSVTRTTFSDYEDTLKTDLPFDDFAVENTRAKDFQSS